MSIPINKVQSAHYSQSKSNLLPLKTSQAYLLTQHPSEINTLRKESINSLTRSLLQKENQQHSQHHNISNHQRPQLKDPRITNMINASQNIPIMPRPAQNPQRNSQMQKLQQLKNRFKKIKTSYEQNHKFINSNITNCLQNYKSRVGLREDHSKVKAFEIDNEDLTFSESREFNANESMNMQSNNRQISFRNEMNPMEHITVNSYSNKENEISSSNQSLTQPYNQGKYKSLSKQLQNMRHNELVQLLIQQIEDNQKNKHLILQQTQIINSLKKQADQRYSQIPKLKEQIQTHQQQLQSKREQIAILLETERKNLEIIEKLKKLHQESSKSDYKSLSILEHSQIHKTSAVRKDICINTSQQSSKIFIEKQDDDSVIDYKLKHDELKKYMNEYINNVNQAYEEYKNNLKQLKDSNQTLKHQNIQITQDIQESHNAKRQLENELLKLSKEFEKLSHALSNSKEVIKELEEQFLILKEQNSEMKSILQRQGSELIELKNNKQMIINEIDDLMIDNEALYHKNELLNEEITEIQSRILANSQIQTEVRAMISGLTQEKGTLQQQLTKQTQQNQKLTKQLASNQQTISKMKQTQQKLQENTKILQAKLKSLTQSLTQLQAKQSMLQKQNLILQETNQQMQKLQEELLFQYEYQKDQKLKLKEQLVQIMDHVKEMQTIYINQLSSNELIKNELAKFWQKQSSKSISSYNLYSQSNNPKQDKPRTLMNHIPHLKSQNSAENMSNSQISCKKNSQMTKQGSGTSSVFRHNINSDELCINSKVSEREHNGINTSSIVDGSRISEKYYSETDSDVHHQLQILKSSKKTKHNLGCVDNPQGKIRINKIVGSGKNKENM